MTLLLSNCFVFSQDNGLGRGIDESILGIESYLEESFSQLKTPGISIGISVNGKQYFINKGKYSSDDQREVDENTRYEIASLSKSFTGLAITQLEDKNLLSVDDYVSSYLDGFKGTYNSKKYEIKISELLYHTSGIKNSDLKRIKDDTYNDSLLNSIDLLNGLELNHVPGTSFEYSSVNYDVLGAIIEKVTGLSYKEYVENEILNKLDMQDSYVGVNYSDDNYVPGHKITMFKPEEFNGPIFTANTPAGYIISTTNDMLKWSIANMESVKNDLFAMTHTGLFSVKPDEDSIYTRGWMKKISDDEELYHFGNNPGFTSYMSINKTDDIAIVVLANSNSNRITEFAVNIDDYLNGGNLKKLENPVNEVDSIFSSIIIISWVIIFLSSIFLAVILVDLRKKRRVMVVSKKTFIKLFMILVYSVPLIIGFYLIPYIFQGTNWYMTIIWSSGSVDHSITMIIVTMLWTFVTYSIHVIFPLRDSYFSKAPELIVCGIISGLSNAATIFIITNAISARNQQTYLFFYFLLALGLYISCRKVLEVTLATLTQTIIRNTRELIFNKLFNSTYTEFLSVKEGELTAVLTSDINQISQIANMSVTTVTSLITVIAAFIYLMTLSLLGTVIIIVVIAVIASIYSFFNSRAMKHFRKSRESQSQFLEKIEGLIRGFKDITLQRNKKIEYIDEIKRVNRDFMSNNVSAFKMFVNAFLLGESFFIIVLGLVTFGLSILFGTSEGAMSMKFVVILIYLLNPINMILNTVPRFAQVRISIGRIKKLIDQLPEKETSSNEMSKTKNVIESISLDNITFEYENSQEKGFKVGPISLEVSQGEILFIIGGNGSGKSTLIHLLTGLFDSMGGNVTLDKKEVDSEIIGEHISAVFSDSHLFDRLYNINLEGKEEYVNKHLEKFNLIGKVSVNNNTFSTVKLSTGQKKRLHLLRVILEDKPILVFDELAADQDPEFRKYFYRELLPELREKGKIIIAVTHDDHYFDVANKVMKLDLGQTEIISGYYSA